MNVTTKYKIGDTVRYRTPEVLFKTTKIEEFVVKAIRIEIDNEDTCVYYAKNEDDYVLEEFLD